MTMQLLSLPCLETNVTDIDPDFNLEIICTKCIRNVSLFGKNYASNFYNMLTESIEISNFFHTKININITRKI